MVDWENLSVQGLTKQLHNYDDVTIIALIETLIKFKNIHTYDKELAWVHEKIIADLRTPK